MFITDYGINWIIPAICRHLLWMEETYILLGFKVPYSTVNFIALLEPYCCALQWLLSVFNSAYLKGIIFLSDSVTRLGGPPFIATFKGFTFRLSPPSFCT